MALIFQDPLSALNPVYTIGRQIGEMFQRHCGASRRESRSKSIELMERVEIPHADSRVDDYPHQFSGGMRQRAMIAIALSLSPSLLIADEPTTALDVTVQAEILGLLRRISAQDGTALILISHDLGVVASTAEHIAVMYSGQVVEQGVTEHVYERPAHPYTRGLLRSLPGEDGGGRLQAIPGAPPDPLNTPSGCRFHPRCEWAQPECAAQIPELNLLSLAGVGARRSRCYFAEDVLRSG
jgi:oligopeptide/dipeptide ABC transporter ATP-binding protein